MFRQYYFDTSRAAIALIFLMTGAQAQPMTCDEMKAALDEAQQEYDGHLLDLEKARAATECLETVSAAFAEAAAAEPVLDEATGESRPPPVVFPECAVAYDNLTAEKADELLGMADDAAAKANDKIRATFLDLETQKADFDAGCK